MRLAFGASSDILIHMNSTQKGKLRPLLEKLIFNLFKVLNENDGQMKGSELMKKVGEVSNLDEWSQERFEKTGNVRWQAVLHLRSIAAVKAGFLVKKKGVWYLTDEGAEAFKLGAKGLFEACNAGYRKWKQARKPVEEPGEEGLGEADTPEEATAAKLSEIEASALASIEDHINRKNPYEFQELCAALLRAMGYYTPFVAPKGPDGGVDITAYRDPLGAVSPRIKVQIKHKGNPSAVDDVRKLVGILGSKESIGIFISSGGFTTEAKREAMRSHVHVELIDLPRFIALWQDFYAKMSDEDKQLLPLQPIYFLSAET
jgi:restriction system protein